MVRKKIGEIMLDRNLIAKDDLEAALLKQKRSKEPIGKILGDMDLVLEEDIAEALSDQFGFPFAKRISNYQFSQSVLDKIGAETALKNQVFPLKIDDKVLYLAMANPLDMAFQSELSFKLAMRISPCVATSEEIKKAIRKHYLTNTPTAKRDTDWVILLVDDQDVNINGTEAVLKKSGYVIYKAANGAEGIKIATQLCPDLIIANVIMPRMDGIEMFKALQAHHEVAAIPVIALSSKNVPEDEYELLEMGFFDFISKPINPIRLLARVRRALKQNGCK